MSERQVQYDLLDEATRLADNSPGHPHTATTLRALVERVRAAEAARQEWADRWQKASMSVLRLTDERDEARGKLDEWLKVLPAITPAEFPAWRSGYAPKGEVTRVGSELGKARGKLDKVRRLIDEWGKEPGFASLCAEALAILDDKE
jgi:hypothetical protein